MFQTSPSTWTLSNAKRVIEPLAFMTLAWLAGRKRFIEYFPGLSSRDFLIAGGVASAFCHIAYQNTRGRENMSTSRDKIIFLAFACISSTLVTDYLKGNKRPLPLTLKNHAKITALFIGAHLGIDLIFSPFEKEAAAREFQEKMEAPKKEKINQVLQMRDPESLIGDRLALSEKARAAFNLIAENTYLRPDLYLGKDFIHGCESINQQVSKTPEHRGYLQQAPSQELLPQLWAFRLMSQIEDGGELTVYIQNLRKREAQEYQQFAALLETLVGDVRGYLDAHRKEIVVSANRTETSYDFS